MYAKRFKRCEPCQHKKKKCIKCKKLICLNDYHLAVSNSTTYKRTECKDCGNLIGLRNKQKRREKKEITGRKQRVNK